MAASKRVLITPLDWGLGHASRCVPLISEYIKQGNEVIVGADGQAAAFLKLHFPQLLHFKYPGFRVRYARRGGLLWQLALQLPSFYRSIEREHRMMRDLVREYQPDLILSDNRYGAWHPQVTSSLITHQISPACPKFLCKTVYSRLDKLFLPFSEILIPDFEGDQNLAGELAHGRETGVPMRFIGPLSRFSSDGQLPDVKSNMYALAAIISGPEPQRQLLEDELIKAFQSTGLPAILVQGKPADPIDRSIGKLRIVNHLEDAELKRVLQQSERLFVRAGYSTLMDLHALGRKAILIPTPGQSEQEYLGAYHAKRAWHERLNQGEVKDYLSKMKSALGTVSRSSEHRFGRNRDLTSDC